LISLIFRIFKILKYSVGYPSCSTRFAVSVEISNSDRFLKNKIQGSQPVEVHGGDLTSPNEIKSIIKRLGSRKAPGPDGVNNIVVKNLPRKAEVYLTYIFNACIKIQYFPKIWRRATVVAIAKPDKDPADQNI
jgi:hypothetical protein